MPLSSRRGFLAGSAGLLGAAAAGPTHATETVAAPDAQPGPGFEPFYGAHQGGITTGQQAYTYFAVFDVTADQRADVQALMARWTAAAAKLCAGQVADETDSAEVAGMKPARLTLTFGFGAALFEKDGKDRFGLAARRPHALIDLKVFPGDQLQPGRTGGDLSVQACADDPQTAFHAVRQLARLAYESATLRYGQAGYVPALVGQTPRNLMGFKDGSRNPNPSDAADMASVVWAGDEGPDWMRGGSYLVARRIRVALEHWDRMTRGFQEQTIGRSKTSGAPIGSAGEFDAEKLDAADKVGNPVIAEHAHVRMASVEGSGARIFRRGYSYNDGLSFTAERWPPWRQAMEFDSGLLFMAYQKDPRSGFEKMFDKMSRFDMLNQFTTHVGSGVFAVAPGVREGGVIGGGLWA